MTQPSTLGIGIDTGGTFTDIVLLELFSGRILRKAKTPTTHGDYAVCIGNAFLALAPSPAESAQLQRVALSTTLATNTVAEHKVHPTGLVIEPGDIAVPANFHQHMALLRSEVGFDAQELVPVSEAELLEKVTPMAARVEGFAVSGYASTRNPAHEQQIAEILRRRFKKPVVLGSELTHQLNFMQRARAAALNAGLLPVILEWIEAVKRILAQRGIGCPLYIVKGDGSLMEAQEAVQRPVQTLFSGPAASLHGGTVLSGRNDAIVIDVGGTTTDIGRVQAGRGRLRRGGIRINHAQIAVDGLDMSTFGLGGDSRFRLRGEGRYRFANQRVLPFCRAVASYPGLSMAQLEADLEGQWHFGDPDLLELVALDQYRPRTGGGSSESNTPHEPGAGSAVDIRERILAALAAQADVPRRVRELSGALDLRGFAPALEDLVRQRAVVRIGLTPTDLFCAEGKAPAFSQTCAEHALRLYALMLDRSPAEFRAQLVQTVRTQATETLAAFLADYGPPLAPGEALMERLSGFMLAPPSEGGPHLAFDPGCPVVLVGAGAPVLFERVPQAMAQRLVTHEHGDVANALGAISSEFLLRETVSIEPLPRGKVELYDHHGKREFATLEEAMTHGRALLHETLHRRAAEHGLVGVHYELQEHVLEDYADYSSRARKELVIARLEAVLTGMPG